MSIQHREPTADLVADAVVTVPAPDDQDERLWSVTTILKAFGDSEGLIHWTAIETAKAAVKQLKTLTAMADDEDAAIEWLTGARFRASKGERSATKLGEDVHAACEQYVVTGTRPALGDQLPNGEMDAETSPYVDSFELWLDRFQPQYTAAEMTVYNTEYGYAGTLDGHAIVDGTPVILDYKTSKLSFDGRGKRKKPWVDVALQLAAYRHAPTAAVWRARRFEQWSRRYYLLNQDERELAVPTPVTDGGLVIHLTPDHCDVYPIDCGPAVFEAFLYAVEAARWSMFTSKKVLGEPLALLDRKAK
ncbi:MAG: hypothetical protein ABI862_14305 [Ilumatobacteraceae bacterium]